MKNSVAFAALIAMSTPGTVHADMVFSMSASVRSVCEIAQVTVAPNGTGANLELTTACNEQRITVRLIDGTEPIAIDNVTSSDASISLSSDLGAFGAQIARPGGQVFMITLKDASEINELSISLEPI